MTVAVAANAVARPADGRCGPADDGEASLRASQVFIALCAPALLALALCVVLLVPQVLFPGAGPVVLGAGVLAQPVAVLAVLLHRRTRRPQGWWSVWATVLIVVLTLSVRDAAFRQTAVMALVVGPLYAAMFTSTRSMLVHLALAGTSASVLVGALAGDPMIRVARVLAVDMVLALTVFGLFILRRRLDAAVQRAVGARDQADHLAAHDPLTGLLNRRGLRTASTGLATGRVAGASTGLGTAPVAGQGVGAVLLDIDHFKRINDTLGHGTGDEVLVRVAAVLAATVRPGDLLARIGGEEFLVVAADVDLAGATDLAERLRLAVRTDGGVPPVTVSVGVAVSGLPPEPAGSVEELYARADQLLYQAKLAGRDRVCAQLPEGVHPGS